MNNVMENIDLIILGVLGIISFVVVLYLISLTLLNFREIKESKQMTMLREYEINMNCNVDIDIIERLDQMIMNCFNEYMILNIEFRELDYINKEIEDIIVREVSHMVIDRISPMLLNKISLMYNKDALSDIISKKVYLHTMNYVLNKNE